MKKDEQSISNPCSKSQGASFLMERITSRKALVGIIGLGYVGLPLVTCFSREGV